MQRQAIERLADILVEHGPALLLTGAGCSTRSGIPDYRDRNGEWKHRPPVMFTDFVSEESVRRRYWARSMNGWRRIENARPNDSHHSLAWLELNGYAHGLITQNVDGLHKKAGSRKLIELHGNLASVSCLQCGSGYSRHWIQNLLLEANPGFLKEAVSVAPDGDAMLDDRDFTTFRIPACPECGGMLKPDVVFFGENIPAERPADGMRMLKAAGCLLIAGSSLMVYSGYRYCREAVKLGLPVVAVNLGRTRADDLLTYKIDADCGTSLLSLIELLGMRPSAQPHAL